MQVINYVSQRHTDNPLTHAKQRAINSRKPACVYMNKSGNWEDDLIVIPPYKNPNTKYYWYVTKYGTVSKRFFNI